MTPPLPGRHGILCVVGPLRIDHFARLETLPLPGGTAPASDLLYRRTGKGADQALAAVRQGASVSLIGAVGGDPHGGAIRADLLAGGVTLTHLLSLPGPTAARFVQCPSSGDPTTVVFPGANQALTPEHIRQASGTIEAAAILLIQLDLPLRTALTAIQLANRAETRVVFNPSPFSPEFPWEEVFVDVLIVNEVEAEQLDANVPPGTDLPVGCLIITHACGTVEVIAPEGDFQLPLSPTAAGDRPGLFSEDTFAGTLAARLALGTPLREAVTLARSLAGNQEG